MFRYQLIFARLLLCVWCTSCARMHADPCGEVVDQAISRKRPTCEHVHGAVVQEGQQYPSCKCNERGEQVFCDDRLLASRKFDANAVIKDGCSAPYCSAPALAGTGRPLPPPFKDGCKCPKDRFRLVRMATAKEVEEYKNEIADAKNSLTFLKSRESAHYAAADALTFRAKFGKTEKLGTETLFMRCTGVGISGDEIALDAGHFFPTMRDSQGMRYTITAGRCACVPEGSYIGLKIVVDIRARMAERQLFKKRRNAKWLREFGAEFVEKYGD